MCAHSPPCPTADQPLALSAAVVAPHPEQGWLLLCNGVVRFDDGGALLPGGQAVAASLPPLLAESTRFSVPAPAPRAIIQVVFGARVQTHLTGHRGSRAQRHRGVPRP